MIVVLLNVYLVILFILVKLKIVPLQPVLEDLAASSCCCCCWSACSSR